MLKIIATAALALVSTACLATECQLPLSRQEATSAKAVFVFQVVSAEFRRGSESPLGDFVLAKLRVVEQVRGKQAASYMAYYAAPECGPKILLGSFYAAFLPTGARSFVGGAFNLLAVGRDYDSRTDGEMVRLVAAGSPRAETVLENSASWLAQIPPPPPPCPRKDSRPGP